MGGSQIPYAINRPRFETSISEPSISAGWHAREANLLAQDTQSYASTYQAAKRLVLDCGMYLFVLLNCPCAKYPGITIEDVKSLTPRFWDFYLDGQCAVTFVTRVFSLTS